MPLPPPVLDHVVVDVRERMDEAAGTFAALGFQLTPRGHHTLGSMNHLAMFATDYLELLGFGEAGAGRPELAPFPIGLNGLVFKTDDADATFAQAQSQGLPILPVQAGDQQLLIVRDSDRIVACERACPHEQADLAVALAGSCVEYVNTATTAAAPTIASSNK
jgi:hypothetical protein